MQVAESLSWWHEHLSRGKGGSRHWAINESVHSSRIASLHNEGSGSSLIVEWGRLLVIDGWSPSRKSQLTYVIASLLMGGSRSANQTVNPVYKRGIKVWRIYLPPYPTLGVGRVHEKGNKDCRLCIRNNILKRHQNRPRNEIVRIMNRLCQF